MLDRLQYKYDESGNITEIHENGILQSRYAYDKLNRIIREDNRAFGKTWLYDYDNNGNILSKREFAFTLKDRDALEEQDGETIMYGYDGDKLLSFGEELFAYDMLGNPTKYRDRTLMWKNGRQLVEYGEVKFDYDGQGRRTKKGNITFTFDSNGRLLKQSNGLSFFYDNTGVVGLTYNGSTYFYRKDVQGNIIAILDSTGRVVVEYKYTAWGEQAIETLNESYDVLSQLNPFRYRGYYYDEETGLYFLKTRYYDPEVGRFISIDDLSYIDPDTINGLNLFAYCGDNPVMNVDPNGTTAQDVFTWFERILTGIQALCEHLAADVLKNVKKIAKGSGYSMRAVIRQHNAATMGTANLGRTLGKVAAVLAAATLAIDIGTTWYSNYKSGNPNWVSASIVDTAYIGVRFAIGVGITALCSLIPIPGLGTLIGVGLAMAADYLITWVMETATNALSAIKSWAAKVGSAIKSGWNKFTSWLKSVFC